MRDPRFPLQGGLPMDGVGGSFVEIACDESGFSGTNLLDAATPVFTHASVDLRLDEAEELIRELRSGFRWSLDEFKSGRFLRAPQAGEALEWLVTALSGRAHVHVVDKEYFLVTRIVDLFLAEPSYAAGTRLTRDNRPAALTLYRAGRAGGRDWSDFLAAETVLFWSAGQRQVLVIHDEQSALTASRLRLLQQALADGADSPAAEGQDTEALPAGVSPLAGLVTIDSRDDPRVQVADLLAGVARRAPDIDDDGLLQPFLSPTSLRAPAR